MSSSRALRDVTNAHKGNYEASAVGEVNVVELMKKNNAIIGGEGNGGIIYPELHYGRDSLVGVALFLTHLANKKMKVSALRASYPEYYMSKNKIELTPQIDVDAILVAMTDKYKNEILQKGEWIPLSDVTRTVEVAGLNHPLFEENDAWLEYKDAFKQWLDVEPEFRKKERMSMIRGDYGDSDNWREKRQYVKEI
jgi:phosphomannomutase